MSRVALKISVERWKIDGAFTISRGSKTEAVVVVVELRNGVFTGHGECVPYARYGESADSVVAAIESLRAPIEQGMTREALQKAMPAGAARNAVDCAMWDLEAKQSGRAASALAGINKMQPLTHSYTLSLDTPEKMAAVARKMTHVPILKIKLGTEGDAARLEAIRKAAPQTRLNVDANEGWTMDNLAANMDACHKYGVEMVEQPLPAADDAALANFKHVIPICADESVFDRASLPKLAGKYDCINIKLDKTGGLTEALALATDAATQGFKFIVGCMVSTSLSIAPALLVAQKAWYADLDAPLLLAKDRADGLVYKDGLVYPPSPALWG